jgi:glycine/serine hydroxymethyltransferase
MHANNPIANQDPEVWKAFVSEEQRQQNTLELIESCQPRRASGGRVDLYQ